MERKNLIIGITVVSVMGISGTLFLMQNSKNDDTKPQVVNTQNISQTQNGNFKDGNYSAEGDYISPGGREKVFISLVIKNNIIEDVVFEGRATDATSKDFQKIFADNFKQKVVGKKISEVKLDKVSGSSLTSSGFNKAINAIKDKAKEL